MADFGSSTSGIEALKSLQRVLIIGNTTGGTSLVVSSSDSVHGADAIQGTILLLQGGNSTGSGNNGGVARLVGGTGDTGGNGGNVLIQSGLAGSGGTPGEVQISNNGGADTDSVLRLASEGANSSNMYFFLGSRTPVGNVSSNGIGNLYFQDSGTIHQASGSGTGAWTMAMVRRVFDNRAAPETTPSVSSGGGTEDGTFVLGVPNGTLKFLKITQSSTETSDFELFSDVARTKLIYSQTAILTGGDFIDRTQTFLLPDDETNLETDTLYYRVTNNGGSAVTYTISLIAEGI